MKVKELIEMLKNLDPEKDILFQVTNIPDYEYTWFYVSPRKYNEIASDDKVEVIDTY